MNTVQSLSSSIDLRQNINEKQCELKKCREAFKRQHLQIINMTRKMKALRKQTQTLQSKINNNKYKTALKLMFTEDQIQALLMKKRRIRHWSSETIQRALQFKFICGNNGYEKLIKEGYSFPSL